MSLFGDFSQQKSNESNNVYLFSSLYSMNNHSEHRLIRTHKRKKFSFHLFQILVLRMKTRSNMQVCMLVMLWMAYIHNRKDETSLISQLDEKLSNLGYIKKESVSNMKELQQQVSERYFHKNNCLIRSSSSESEDQEHHSNQTKSRHHHRHHRHHKHHTKEKEQEKTEEDEWKDLFFIDTKGSQCNVEWGTIVDNIIPVYCRTDSLWFS